MTTPSRTGSNQLNASAGNLSASATIPANTNIAVAFWAHWDNNGGSTASSLAINSVTMTIAAQLSETSDATGQGVAVLINPGTGSLTHALTWSGGGARSEGGEVVFVYYQDGKTDAGNEGAYRAAAVDQNTGTPTSSASVANTDTTDRVVGFYECFNSGTPTISGVTAFIDNAALNSHEYDVGDATGLTGTVSVSSSVNNEFASAAAISLKESVAGGADPEGGLIGSKLLNGGLLLGGVLIR